MDDRDARLGGFAPGAGLTADTPRVPRLPVPNLLRELLSQHLDPGYAAMAARRVRTGTERGRAADLGWRIVAALLLAAVFAAAIAATRSLEPGLAEAQKVLVRDVRGTEADNDTLTGQRDELAAEVDALSRRQLRTDATGRGLLDGLDGLALAAASTPVIGPGLSVTVSDPGAERDLTDAAKQRVPGSRQVILDRDLQLVVNSLWAAGAEAVSVGGVRIGPNATMRQAGGAILVDNHPVSSPYQVLAIGPPNRLRDDFEAGPGLLRLRLLEASYGASVDVGTADGLSLPAGSVRDIRVARALGP
ncbi:MAG TPA: DUF881 domain-containing protein [Mycolicibacterium fallax]|nr:DUF881 domain-containing protein [Mycolicibacterium fallax]